MEYLFSVRFSSWKSVCGFVVGAAAAIYRETERKRKKVTAATARMNAICKYMRWECRRLRLNHTVWLLNSMRCWQCYNALSIYNRFYDQCKRTRTRALIHTYFRIRNGDSVAQNCILWSVWFAVHFFVHIERLFHTESALLFVVWSVVTAASCYVNVSDKLISYFPVHSILCAQRTISTFMRTKPLLFHRSSFFRCCRDSRVILLFLCIVALYQFISTNSLNKYTLNSPRDKKKITEKKVCSRHNFCFDISNVSV